MRKFNLTALLLAAGAAALASRLLHVQNEVVALQDENTDLWEEGQSEFQANELLRDELALAHGQVRMLDAEWRDTLGKLSRSRAEVSTLQDTNQQLLAALAQHLSPQPGPAGFWVWLPERHRPDGPFDNNEQACAHAESLAALHAGQPVYLLGAGRSVVYTAGMPALHWSGQNTPVSEYELALERA